LLPLWADEPIRALVSFHMLLDHQWLNPHINGLPYLNKPPLYNWVLASFFKLFGVHNWVVRLPSFLSILGFSFQLYFLGCRIFNDYRKAILLSTSLLISGNFLVFSSLLGHIDIPYSWVVFNQIYFSFYYSKRKRYRMLFGFSYLLCFVGFMMKGLPSLVFQGLSLLVIFLHNRALKKLFHPAHFLSILVFFSLNAIYFWQFSKIGSLSDFLWVLFKESSQRTFTNKTWWESAKHLFEFPLKLLIDFLPSIFLIFILLSKKYRQRLKDSSFYALFWVFAINLIPYWLSPDYRARYTFALIPLISIPLIDCLPLQQVKWSLSKKTFIFMLFIIFAMLLFCSFVHVFSFQNIRTFQLASIYFFIFTSIYLLLFLQEHPLMHLILFFLLGKLIFNLIVIPQRNQEISKPSVEEIANKIAVITENKKLEMMNCNVDLDLNWYISTHRKLPTKMQTQKFDTSVFYIVPEEIICCQEDVRYYFRFIRKFENKKMALVKFKHFRHYQKTDVENEIISPKYYLNQ